MGEEEEQDIGGEYKKIWHCCKGSREETRRERGERGRKGMKMNEMIKKINILHSCDII
jgi:hypothetical protein